MTSVTLGNFKTREDYRVPNPKCEHTFIPEIINTRYIYVQSEYNTRFSFQL
jgi:hypothetical protein